MRNAAPTHVVVAALVGDDGRILINQRLPGTHMSGRWEFPGGKVECGESVHDALARELREELGVTPTRARPLIRIRHAYSADHSVLLDCWRIDAWDGEVQALEGHPLEWVTPDMLPARDLLEADRPMTTALRLPPRYAVTDVAPSLAEVERLLDDGHTLIQLRAPAMADPDYRAVAADAVALCRMRGAALLLNATPELAAGVGADGVHLTAARAAALRDRPLPAGRWVAASCHDAAELAHALAIGCDFVVLGPVAATRSHPGAEALGWEAFAGLADCAGLPVYALGGMRDDDLETAWRSHGQGIAGISAFRIRSTRA